MKRSIVTIFGIGILLYPLICFASYVIHLKDGREFATDRYWEEGDQIKFKRYGGVIGIQKGLVKEVEEIEDLPEEKEAAKPETPSAPEKADDVKKAEVPEAAENGEAVEQELPEAAKKRGATEEGSDQKAATDDTNKEGGKEDKDIDVAYYKNQKKEIVEKYREAKKKLDQAIIAHNRLAQREAKKEIEELDEQRSNLASELKEKNKGVLPNWW